MGLPSWGSWKSRCTTGGLPFEALVRIDESVGREARRSLVGIIVQCIDDDDNCKSVALNVFVHRMWLFDEW